MQLNNKTKKQRYQNPGGLGNNNTLQAAHAVNRDAIDENKTNKTSGRSGVGVGKNTETSNGDPVSKNEKAG